MAKKGEEGPSVVVEELPRTIVRRIVKDKLSRLSSSSSASSSRRKAKGASAAGAEEEEAEREGEGLNVHKDALLAFSESARIFIHYLSATANDICRESKRQIINAEDVFKALDEIEFSEFIEPLRVSLEDFRRQNAVKKSASKSKDRKRKMEEELPAENGKASGGEEVDGDDEDDGDAHNSE